MLSCRNTGMIVLPPLMTITSIIAISSLNDQQSYNYLCNSVFVDGQIWSMSSAKALWCLSSRVASLISSAVMQCGIPCMIILV